jgi:hypothetical protein
MNTVGSESNQKNAYEAPRLRVYGDVAALTQVVGAKGGNDGGVTPMDKKSI